MGSLHASSHMQSDKQSFHYIIRSGFAGGFAGCIVRTFHILLKPAYLPRSHRQRRSSLLSIGSKSSFRLPIQSIASTPVCPPAVGPLSCHLHPPSFQASWSGAFRAGARIYSDGGFLALFQGHSATLLRIFPYAAIKFMAYDQIENVRFSLVLTCRPF